jgi:dihydroneopterin aldolase/2-amino-4-hydroxy-6-hydroxymethyldihydropteridine diphosphokinase
VTDSILLTGVSATGYHGVFDFEKREGQEFSVDIKLTVNHDWASSTDDVRWTVNYASVAQIAHEAIVGPPVDLIETLADQIAREVINLAGVLQVEVTVHKPHAPIAVTFGNVSVTRTRSANLSQSVRVALGIGSNMGDRQAHLQSVLDALNAASEVNVIDVSPVYETAPVGGPEQQDFLNAVVIINTALSPQEVLDLAHDCEIRAGRVREVHWGPRTLDVDVLAYGALQSDDTQLTLPHPRIAERGFVLIPWADVDPEFVPLTGKTVADLARAVGSDGVHLTDIQLALWGK